MHLIQFVLFFLVAPTALLLAVHGARGVRPVLAAAGVIALGAVILLVALDAVLVAAGAWDRTAEAVLVDIGGLPLEDVFLFALQALFVTVVTAILLRRHWWRT